LERWPTTRRRSHSRELGAGLSWRSEDWLGQGLRCFCLCDPATRPPRARQRTLLTSQSRPPTLRRRLRRSHQRSEEWRRLRFSSPCLMLALRRLRRLQRSRPDSGQPPYQAQLGRRPPPSRHLRRRSTDARSARREARKTSGSFTSYQRTNRFASRREIVHLRRVPSLLVGQIRQVFSLLAPRAARNCAISLGPSNRLVL
jgi:hypothetical protein